MFPYVIAVAFYGVLYFGAKPIGVWLAKRKEGKVKPNVQ